MKPKIFLDSSVIILGFEKSESNSALILDLVLDKKIEAVVNEKILAEIRSYFKRRRNRHFAFLVESLIRKNCRVVPNIELEEKMKEFKNKIKERDLEHLATAKLLDLIICAYDRDFEGFPEYRTPKKLLDSLNIISGNTEY